MAFYSDGDESVSQTGSQGDAVMSSGIYGDLVSIEAQGEVNMDTDHEETTSNRSPAIADGAGPPTGLVDASTRHPPTVSKKRRTNDGAVGDAPASVSAEQAADRARQLLDERSASLDVREARMRELEQNISTLNMNSAAASGKAAVAGNAEWDKLHHLARQAASVWPPGRD